VTYGAKLKAQSVEARGHTRFDPTTEGVNALRWPRPVARHRTVFKPFENRLRVVGNVVALPQVEAGHRKHRPSVPVSEQRLHVAFEAQSVLFAVRLHASVLPGKARCKPALTRPRRCGMHIHARRVWFREQRLPSDHSPRRPGFRDALLAGGSCGASGRGEGCTLPPQPVQVSSRNCLGHVVYPDAHTAKQNDEGSSDRPDCDRRPFLLRLSHAPYLSSTRCLRTKTQAGANHSDGPRHYPVSAYPPVSADRTPVRRNTCPVSGRTDRHVTASTALRSKPGVTTTRVFAVSSNPISTLKICRL